MFNTQFFSTFSITSLILISTFLTSCLGTDGNTKKAFEAIKLKEWDSAKAYVKKGVTINGMTKDGYTLLHRSEDPSLTKLLIEQGHDVNQRSGGMFSQKEKEGALKAQKNLLTAFPKLKEDTTEFDKDDPFMGENLAPLHKVRNPDVIKILLDAGADPNSTSSYADTPLAEVKSLRALEYLLDAGADMRFVNYNRTPLHKFIKNNSIKSFEGGEENYFQAIKLFVENGVDMKATDNGDLNVLHAANYKVTSKILGYLLKNGANPKLADGNWGGAFCLAIKESQDSMVLTYVQHDYTLLWHDCDNARRALQYAKEEARYNNTHKKLLRMKQIVEAELSKP